MSEAPIASILAPRIPTHHEIAVDGLVHLVGLVAGIVGATILLAIAIMNRSPFEITAVSIYAAGMILMFACSAAYNLFRKNRRRELLRRLDHAAIFVMIAGTYTPFTLLSLSGTWAVAMTALVWSIAGAGVVIKLLWPSRMERISTLIYILLGWVGVIAFEPLILSLPASTLLMLATGGALYMIGVIFHVWERLPFQNAIWHSFVVAAASVHYGAIFRTLA